MSWVTIAVAVGSAVISAEQQRSVARKQDQALANQIRQQQESERKVAARTAQFIDSQKQQTDQPQKTAAATEYANAVKANQQMATQPLASTVGVSDAYKKQAADDALGVASFAKNRGDLVASIDAPGLQRQQNQRNIANFGIDVDQINRQQKSADFIDQLKLNSIHANPWVSLLSGVGSGLARARLLGAAGGTPTGYDLDANQAAGGIDLRG